jgi:Na+-translocating ferredoxin:NAD+ oxidoreductase RnfG subunit
MRRAGIIVVLLFAGVILIFGCQESENISGDLSTPRFSDFPGAVKTDKIDMSEIAITVDLDTEVFAHKDAHGLIIGYSVNIFAVSKSGAFPVEVNLTPDACVKSARVISYRWHRGRNVTLPKFTGQFTGKCDGKRFVLGRDIHAISGATLSAKAMVKQVNKSIAIVKRLAKNI